LSDKIKLNKNKKSTIEKKSISKKKLKCIAGIGIKISFISSHNYIRYDKFKNIKSDFRYKYQYIIILLIIF